MRYDPPAQPLLFAPSPASNSSKTSVAAAAAASAKAPSCRDRIGTWLIFAGARGGTHEEIAAGTEIRLDTVKPRVHELGELGKVRALSKTRKSTAGAEVLVFVDAGCVCGRDVEPWPIPRPNWKQRAEQAEQRAAEAERRAVALEQRLSQLQGVS